jgi:hypothetical protein
MAAVVTTPLPAPFTPDGPSHRLDWNRSRPSAPPAADNPGERMRQRPPARGWGWGGWREGAAQATGEANRRAGAARRAGRGGFVGLGRNPTNDGPRSAPHRWGWGGLRSDRTAHPDGEGDRQPLRRRAAPADANGVPPGVFDRR